MARIHDIVDAESGASERHESAPPPPQPARTLLALQRSAGNAAVSGMLARKKSKAPELHIGPRSDAAYAGDAELASGAAGAVEHDPQARTIDTRLRELEALHARIDAAAEDNEKDDPHVWGEERGDERDELVAGIAAVRELVVALADDRVKAHFFRRLNAISPYSRQGQNANVLARDGKSAGARTCNVTSIAMALEALGRKPEHFDPSVRPVLDVIADHEKGRLSKAQDREPGQGIDDLRMADFLQLVAVYVCLPEAARTDPKLAKKHVSAAYAKAVYAILKFEVLEKISELFGVSSELFDHAQRFKLRALGSQHRYPLEGKQKKAAAAAAKAGQDPAEFDHDDRMRTMFGKNHKKRLAAHDRIVDIDEYRDSILDHVGAEMDRGNQVAVNLYNHYARVQAVSEEHLVVDDPNRGQDAKTMSWEEARAMGYFARYLVLRR